MPRLRVAAAQLNLVVGDLDGNAARILETYERAEREGCDLVAFPELAITGYPPEDLLLRPAFVAQAAEALEKLAARTGRAAAVVGFPEADGDLYNAAAVCANGKVLGVYRKVLLPNYGVFDEERYFVPGSEVLLASFGRVEVAVTICEDLWFPWGPMASAVAATRAADHGAHLFYVAQFGGQDELVFDGQSAYIDPQGRLQARAGAFTDELLVVDLALEEGATARLSERPRRAPATDPRPALAVNRPGLNIGRAAGAGIPEIRAQDYARFGPVEIRPLSRIKKVSGPFLHRSWLNVPHVTHADEADITELDAYRRELDAAAKPDGYRVTLLAFLVKASVSALREFPEVNSSLSAEKDSLVLKSYYNIGIAVDTPDGLVVPVVKDADRKGILALSKEFGPISAKAREGKLSPSDMQGGTFTISSLGGIGGTGFTPIVNAVANDSGLGRVRVRPAADAAGLAVLRPPGDRRCAGRPVHPAPVHRARRRPPPGPLAATSGSRP